MRTTMDIDPDLLAKAVEITGESSKGKAVNRALEELIYRDAVEKLRAARGTFNLRHPSEWHERDLESELEHRRERLVDNR